MMVLEEGDTVMYDRNKVVTRAQARPLNRMSFFDCFENVGRQFFKNIFRKVGNSKNRSLQKYAIPMIKKK